MRISRLLEVYGLKVIKTLDRVHGHYICASSEPGVYYLVIKTSRVLKYPRSNGINYDGPMLGIRQSYASYLTMTVNYVAWLLNGELVVANARDVLRFITANNVCVKKGFEVICHYPLSMTKRVITEPGLMKFMRWGP